MAETIKFALKRKNGWWRQSIGTPGGKLKDLLIKRNEGNLKSMLLSEIVDTVIQGDSLEVLKTFPNDFVDCAITSPPYWGLRDYGAEGQLGLEKTPEEYVEKLVLIFREVRRTLKKTGTFWLVIGDIELANFIKYAITW